MPLQRSLIIPIYRIIMEITLLNDLTGLKPFKILLDRDPIFPVQFLSTIREINSQEISYCPVELCSILNLSDRSNPPGNGRK